jgi:hypothetical protein
VLALLVVALAQGRSTTAAGSWDLSQEMHKHWKRFSDETLMAE